MIGKEVSRAMDRKKLVNESIDYIMEHLEEDLSLDAVADHIYRLIP